MNLDEYQKLAATTVSPNIEGNLYYFALGLAGESGEVADKIKKSLRDSTLSADSLVLELGDVLWYVSQLANTIGYDLSEVAERNINKLSNRAERGVISGEGDER